MLGINCIIAHVLGSWNSSRVVIVVVIDSVRQGSNVRGLLYY